VVDAAMVDGAASLMSIFYGMSASGRWNEQRGDNLLDGGAPFYDTYETADGKYVSIGALEPKFFAEMAQRIGLDTRFVKGQYERKQWPEMRAAMSAILRGKTRDEWSAVLEGSDACFAPVLSIEEAPKHAHARSRGAFVEVAGVVQPGPAPRFDRSSAEPPTPAPAIGVHTDAVLAEAGFSADEITALHASGVALRP